MMKQSNKEKEEITIKFYYKYGLLTQAKMFGKKGQ
jgi:hypothetical protein